MNPFGKYTEEIKSRVPYETKIELAKLAHDACMSESEFIRTVLMMYIHGKDEVMKRQQHQLSIVADLGKGK